MKEIIIKFKTDGETNLLQLICTKPRNMVVTANNESKFCEPSQDLLGLSADDIRIKAAKESLTEMLELLNELE